MSIDTLLIFISAMFVGIGAGTGMGIGIKITDTLIKRHDRETWKLK